MCYPFILLLGGIVMILCIERKALKVSDKVQNKVDIQDLLVNHCKYFEDEVKAIEEDYVPIDFMVSLRTTYSNQVLEIPQMIMKHQVRYYKLLTNIDLLIHKGYDLMMYLSSIGIMSCVNYAKGFDELMMKTEFVPMGVYNRDSGVLNPIFYSHILLDDTVADEFSKYLKEGHKLVPISEMKTDGNLLPILNTIIEVKPREE